MTTPAGWYPNPENAGQLRYWDGTTWTEHLAPNQGPEPTLELPLAPTLPPPPPPTAVPFSHPAPAQSGPEAWYQKKWVWGVAAAAVIFGVIGSIGGSDDTAPASDKQPQAVETVFVTPTPTPADKPTPSPEPEPVAETSPKSLVGDNEPATGDTFVMPNEVGKVLQVAQDDLQAVTGNPFFFTDSKDATDQDRFQVLDSGWQVCSQDPAPGKVLPTDYLDIVFYVVRTSEDCP